MFYNGRRRPKSGGDVSDSVESRLAVFEHRASALEQMQAEIADGVSRMADSVSRMAAVNEQSERRHAEMQDVFKRIFDKFDDHEKRVGTLELNCRAIETEVVYFREARGWMITTAIGTIGTLIIALGFFVSHTWGVQI